MTIFHGTPINPKSALVAAIGGGHAMISYAYPRLVEDIVSHSRGFALDNGAFSHWKSGAEVDVDGFLSFARRFSSACFAIIPDVIGGTEEENDRLICGWPKDLQNGAPVWHLHESLDRLDRLSREWEIVCLGSSGSWSTPGTDSWFSRMDDAFDVMCDGGKPRCRVHGLRMASRRIVERYPFDSVDSSTIARNIGLDCKGMGGSRTDRAREIRARMESAKSPLMWRRAQASLFKGEA